MGDKRNYAALDWVLGEIGETLKDARQALEAYVEDPRDTARIRFCLTHIHQVHGSLQMVEFHGASLFAEEMELLAAALMHNKVSNDKEAQEVLMRSLLQLPLYLEQVKSTHDDHPAIVMPLLNDLRAVRKQAYLSETNLFHPDLSSVGRLSGKRHEILDDNAKLKPVLKKLQDMYQFAAASVLRGIKIDDNLEYIHKVFVRLETLTRGTHCHPTWYVSAALAEALTRDDIELSVAVRGLLRHLAREIRALNEHCPAAFDAPPPEPLLRNLLYYVGLAHAGGARVASVKQRFQLDQAIFGGSNRDGAGKSLLSTPEPEAVRAVVTALQEELNSAKFLMDRALSGQGGLSEIEETLPFIKRISDTLAVLGIADMRKHTLEQYNALVGMCKTGNVSDSVLIDVAGRLADLENRLEAIGKGRQTDYTHVDERAVEIDTAKQAVLTECRNGMDTVKEAIIESMSAKWDPSSLPRAVETLHDIRGGFNIVPLPRPAAILDACSAYIQRELLERDTTPGEGLQTLAEAIASVDYYLERLVGGHGDDLDSFLEMAEESLTELGYRPAGIENYTRVADRPEPDSGTDRTAAAETGRVSPPVSPAGEMTPAQADVEAGSLEQTTEEADEWSDSVVTPESTMAQQSTQPLESAAEPEAQATDLEGEDLAATSVSDVSHLAQPATDEPDSDLDIDLSSPALSDDSDAEEEAEESAIDDEIIEIFIEEAAEVQETLAEYFPRWRDNPGDHESLVTVRRSFHTLKGSGRMVEAMEVGELAWSVENMLNRIMDGSTAVLPAHYELIEKVLRVVPALIEAFAQRQPNPEAALTERYIEWAGQLAKGEVPAELDGENAAVDTPVSSDDADENEDQILWEIFASEATTHLDVVRGFIEATEEHSPLYVVPSDDLQRALHTLKGSAHMAAVTPIATLIAPLENFVKELRTYQVRVNDDILQLVRDAVQYTQQGLDSIERNEIVELPKLDQFIARVRELRDVHVTPLIHLRDQEREGEKPVDPRLLAIFMAEEMNLLLDAHKIIADWQTQPDEVHPDINPLIAELHTLGEGACQANLPAMSCLSNQLKRLHAGALAGQLPIDDNLFAVLNPAHDTLLDMVDAVAAGQNIPLVSDALQTRIDQLLETLPTEEAAGVSSDAPADQYDAQGQATEDTEIELTSEFLPDMEAEPADGEAPLVADDSRTAESADPAVADPDLDDYGIDLLSDADAYDDLELPTHTEADPELDAWSITPEASTTDDMDESIDLGLPADNEFDLSLHTEDHDAIELGSFDADSETIEFAPEGLISDEAGEAVAVVHEENDSERTPGASGEHGFELVDEDDDVFIDFSSLAADDEAIELESLAFADANQADENVAPGELDGAEDRPDVVADGDTHSTLGSDDFDDEISLESESELETEAGSGESFGDGLSIEELDGLPMDSAPESGEPVTGTDQYDDGALDDATGLDAMRELEDADPESELHAEAVDQPGDLTEAGELLPDGEAASDAYADQESDREEDLESFEDGWPAATTAGPTGEPADGVTEDEAAAVVDDDLLSGDDIEDEASAFAFDREFADAGDESWVGGADTLPQDDEPADADARAETDLFGADIDAGEEPALSDADEFEFTSETEQDEAVSEREDAQSADATDAEMARDALSTAPLMGSYEREREAAAKDDQPISEPALTPWQLGGAATLADIDTEDYDQDILEIFLEEANELIEELDESIHTWESNSEARDAPETMKRALHTLKGGARLSGLKNLGELTHNYESYLIATGHPSNDPAFFNTIHQYQDVLLSGVRAVRARLDGTPIPDEPARAAIATPESDASPEPVFTRDEAQVVPFAPRAPARSTEFEPFPEKTADSRPEPQVPQQRQGSQEMVKVSADLLEELVNLAGETTISRGRLEQQVSDLTSAVDEVDTTLGRLNEQLRRLDMETEAQVLFRQERMASYEEFDPLEMDRYSQLQQLTRSLMESASDLMDLKRTLGDKLRDTETLLLQQSRITSSLQEGLMRSRMVPFSRLVPRLRRIVRQVAAELGKQVNLEFDNVEGEMDRSVLERMVAPLEHMLRNAVDHGIESPEDRVSAGKPAAGRVLLSLAREGGDILLRLADDGRGINIARVRELAVERGMMTENSDLADYDVMQFILQAGFSTAENVTQISGRGVGMDVVASEIKQLGGSMGIDSRTGVGTQFTVRLPFTVSVNRALMVQLGAETYAIPLNSIEGIVRVSPYELEHYYTQPDARFEYAGDSFQVRHLNAMITPGFLPRLEGQILPLPVILVRSGQHTMALQVDGLMGSREIVVKSLGPQFAMVQGLSGATVMGDGSVVVILDVHALARREMALLGSGRSTLGVAQEPDQAPAQTLKTVMVVDDSVTVRKVTTRFLEREGYNVITAKDGVDALQVLQEQIPDLMLLDIEMPRMDGFEVARNVRSTSRWKHIPIIMITSRTGDKHRQHALSIGVNEYLGKPYQEEVLNRLINSLLAKKIMSA